MKKTACQLLILALGLYLVVSLSRELLSLIKKGKRMEIMRQKLTDLQSKNESLKERLGYIQSEEFVEKEAREKLNMAKEGEVIVVLPGKLELMGQALEKNDDLPNWQQWLKLFF